MRSLRPTQYNPSQQTRLRPWMGCCPDPQQVLEAVENWQKGLQFLRVQGLRLRW